MLGYEPLELPSRTSRSLMGELDLKRGGCSFRDGEGALQLARTGPTNHLGWLVLMVNNGYTILVQNGQVWLIMVIMLG